MTVDELGRELRTTLARIEDTMCDHRTEIREDMNKLWSAHTEHVKETGHTLKDHHGKIEGLKVRMGFWAGGASAVSGMLAWVSAKLSGH